MGYCYRCGAATVETVVDGVSVPTCPEHGPLWLLVRTGATADVLIHDGDRVLLARRAREPQHGLWSVIGGFVDPGETSEETVRREVAEELGVDVTLDGVIAVYGADYGEGEWLQAVAFAGRIDQPPVPRPSEILELAWFDPGKPPSDGAWNLNTRLADFRQWRQGR